ncbi:hypothetical protein FHS02_000059 [Massilia umbonata]|uniref:Uncharacterized protein n=1 Tax=Pseudoduganella umbonata TaxID=864828 RepID=A0A7W5E5Y3_9BURK|nr:hypothetical protein [Pseudoduganella umbonata]
MNPSGRAAVVTGAASGLRPGPGFGPGQGRAMGEAEY